MANEKINAENNVNVGQPMSIDSRVSSLEAKFEMFIGEMRDFKNEIREQNKMRAAEIAEIRQKQESDMKEIRASIDGMGKHVRNLAVAAIVGIGAIAIAVIGFIATK